MQGQPRAHETRRCREKSNREHLGRGGLRVRLGKQGKLWAGFSRFRLWLPYRHYMYTCVCPCDMCAYVYSYVLCVHVSMCVCDVSGCVMCVHVCVCVCLSSLLQSPALHRVQYLSSHPTVSHRTRPPFPGKTRDFRHPFQAPGLRSDSQPALGTHSNCTVWN